MKTRDMNDKKSRIIARGEFSDHSHVITGDCEIYEKDGDVYVRAGKNCAIKHLIESVFIESGIEKWTGEHKDIDLSELPSQVRHGDVLLDRVNKNTYKYIQQVEYNPYEKAIRQVRD